MKISVSQPQRPDTADTADTAETAAPEATEQASVTLWVLYWALIVLFISGFSIDLWRGVAVRRSLVEQAEAAASAGANGIDEELFRSTGEVALDHDKVLALVNDNLAHQGEYELIDHITVQIAENRNEVTVTVSGSIDFTLVRLFLSDEAPLTLNVSASASPVVEQ